MFALEAWSLDEKHCYFQKGKNAGIRIEYLALAYEVPASSEDAVSFRQHIAFLLVNLIGQSLAESLDVKGYLYYLLHESLFTDRLQRGL